MERAQMVGMLQQLVTALYAGGPVPPSEGGVFFRTICEKLRQQGDLFWTERRLHDLARELGYWPWTVQQITASIRKPDAQPRPEWLSATAVDEDPDTDEE